MNDEIGDLNFDGPAADKTDEEAGVQSTPRASKRL
jgi:hypothetical protein